RCGAPPRAELNTIRVPSGDHVAPQFASAGRLVRLTNPEPSALITPISSPAEWESRTSRRLPSGDHTGQHAAPGVCASAEDVTRYLGPPAEPTQNATPSPSVRGQSKANVPDGSWPVSCPDAGAAGAAEFLAFVPGPEDGRVQPSCTVARSTTAVTVTDGLVSLTDRRACPRPTAPHLIPGGPCALQAMNDTSRSDQAHYHR